MVRVIASIPRASWLPVCLDLLSKLQYLNPAASSLAHAELLVFVQSSYLHTLCPAIATWWPARMAKHAHLGTFLERMLGAVLGKMPQVAFVSSSMHWVTPSKFL
jgi:hypothetical protein